MGFLYGAPGTVSVRAHGIRGTTRPARSGEKCPPALPACAGEETRGAEGAAAYGTEWTCRIVHVPDSLAGAHTGRHV